MLRSDELVVVIGQGYVGLPLAQAAVAAGARAVGVDLNERVVSALNAGVSHVGDVTDAELLAMLDDGYRATTDTEVVAGASVVVICVPTPLSDEGAPDLGAVVAATRGTALHLPQGALVILESTTYPGTTEEVVLPILEGGGLSHSAGDFFLAFSPERVDPGNHHFGIRNTPKLVGGASPEAGRRAQEFYESFVDEVVLLKGTREAELAKLLENTYRHVNIALVNEIARFCHDMQIDVWDAIRGASTKPFGFQAFRPGAGVGGHCIPIDPNYLSHHVRKTLGYPFRLVELAQDVNSSMPAYVASRISDILNENSRSVRGSVVLLLGVSYKANVADMRESPAIPLCKILLDRGALVEFFDPLISSFSVGSQKFDVAEDPVAACKRAHVVVLLQPHAGLDLDLLIPMSRAFFDTSGVVDRPGVTRL